MIDSFKTIRTPASARITRKRSRFLAFLLPVASIEEIMEAINGLRKEHHDAVHVCSAYRLHANPEPQAGSDDDGEPSGSAGGPMLQQLERAELLDVLAAVVRHFGGVKLGVGGLVRAYGDAVMAAIEAAAIVRRRLLSHIDVSYPPTLTSAVMRTIHQFGAEIERIEYDALAQAVVAVPTSRLAEFVGAMQEATGGQATVEVRA